MILSIISFILFYGIMWGFTIFCREKLLKEAYGEFDRMDRHLGHVFYGAAWPLYLVPFIFWALAVRRIPMPKLPSFKREIPEPSDILCGMICTLMLQHPENFDSQNNWCYKKIRVNHYSVRINEQSYEFTREQMDKISGAYNTAWKFRVDKIEAREKYEKEHKALDYINTIME